MSDDKQSSARRLDDIEKRQRYREDKLAGKKSIKDEYTGERIFDSNKTATVRQHATNKLTDDDHITPLAVIDKRYQGLSDEQKKKMANMSTNQALTNAKLNRSKGSMENHEYLIRESKKGIKAYRAGDKKTSKEQFFKVQKQAPGMLKQEVKSRTVMGVQAKGYQIKNTIQKATAPVEKAKNMLQDEMMPLLMEGIHQGVSIAKGDIGATDALKNIAKKDIELVVDRQKHKLEKSAYTTLEKGLTKVGACELGPVIAAAYFAKNTLFEYIDGDISSDELVEKIGQQAAVAIVSAAAGEVGKEIGIVLGTALGPLGTIGGGIAGEIIGTMIAEAACTMIALYKNTEKKYMSELKGYTEKEKRIRRLEQEALREIEIQKENLKKIIQKEFKVWDDKIEEGYRIILCSACEQSGNYLGVTEGLDEILSIFGLKAKFHTVEEYEDQLDQPLVFKF